MNQIYFVSSSGSNSNSGSNEAPWASVQYAIDTITSQAVIQNIDLLIKEGSYQELVSLIPFSGSGTITLRAQNGSPVIGGIVQTGSTYSLDSISLKNTAGKAIAVEAGTLLIKDLTLSTSDSCIAVSGQGVVSTSGTLQIEGNPRSVISCSDAALIVYNSTLIGNATFTSAFCQISGGKVTIFNSLSSNSFGGDRVNISGGSLTVKTLSTSPVDTLPGSSYGFATGGEIYNENQLIFPADSTLNSAAASVINASLITEGTLSNARLSPTVTTQGNLFNGLSQLVKTNDEGKLPAIDGSLLTGIVIPIPSASSIVSGTLNNARLSEDVTLAGNAFNTANSLLKLTSLGKLPALDGSDLTNLPQYNTTTDASLLTSGTLANGRLSSSVTLAGNSFNAANNLVRLDVLGRLPAVDGSQITNLPTSSANASSITSGTLDNARLTTSVTLEGNTFNAASKLVKLDSLLRLPAVDGSQLTGLAFTTDASLLTSGTLEDARLSTTVTIQGNIFNSPNSLVKLDNSSRLPAVDASLLTNLPSNNNASNLTTGTIADGRLTANVTLAGNTFNTANNLVKTDGTNRLPALDGSNLTGITKTQVGLSNVPNIDTSDATNLTTGTLPNARLSATVTTQGNTFNTANNLVRLDGTGRLPAADGSLLTNLPGGGGTTNLSLANRTSTTLDVLSSTGTDVTLPTASTTEAGLMSAADKVALAAGGGGSTASPYIIPLEISSKFQAYWDLKEDGDITDSIGGVILSSNGTNVTNTIKAGSRILPAKKFVGGEYLLGSASGVVQPTGSFSFIVGVSISVLPTADQYWGIVAKDSGGSQRSYAIILSGDSGKFVLQVTTNGSTLIIAECPLVAALNTNYFIHAKFNAATSLISISVNGSTPVTASASSVFNSTDQFVIGSFISKASFVSLRGSIAFVGLSSLLTEVEAETIRNGGSWKTLSSDNFIAAAQAARTDYLLYEDLTESNGTALIGKVPTIGNTWQRFVPSNTGDITIQNNKIVNITSNPARALTKLNTLEYELLVEFDKLDSNPLVEFDIYIKETSSLSPRNSLSVNFLGAGSVVIASYLAGTFNGAGSDSYTVPGGFLPIGNTVRVLMTLDSYFVYVNDLPVFSGTVNANLVFRSGDYVGFYFDPNCNAAITKFEVTGKGLPSAAPASGLPVSYLFDEFTGNNGTTLVGRTPTVGNIWQTSVTAPYKASSLTVQDNNIRNLTASEGDAYSRVNSEEYDLEVIFGKAASLNAFDLFFHIKTKALGGPPYTGVSFFINSNTVGKVETYVNDVGPTTTETFTGLTFLSTGNVLLAKVRAGSIVVYLNNVLLTVLATPTTKAFVESNYVGLYMAGGTNNGIVESFKVKPITPTLYLEAASIRDQATSVVQTINSNGSISQVVYTLPTGTITDSYTYGPNSLVEPTSVTRGNLVLGGSTGLTLTPLTWTTTNGGSQAGNILTLATIGSGALAFTTINSANNFELITTYTAAAPTMVVFLDEDAVQAYGWPGGQTFLSGQYIVGTDLYSASAPANSEIVSTVPSYPFYVKMKKSGADLLIQKSSDGITYTTVLVRTGVLVGQPLYPKALLAASTNTSIDIKLYV